MYTYVPIDYVLDRARENAKSSCMIINLRICVLYEYVCTHIFVRICTLTRYTYTTIVWYLRICILIRICVYTTIVYVYDYKYTTIVWIRVHSAVAVAPLLTSIAIARI